MPEDLLRVSSILHENADLVNYAGIGSDLPIDLVKSNEMARLLLAKSVEMACLLLEHRADKGLYLIGIPETAPGRTPQAASSPPNGQAQRPD